MEAEMPREWGNENLPRVLRHIKAIRDHVQSFIAQVARRLV
jgi:hypothetical protein